MTIAIPQFGLMFRGNFAHRRFESLLDIRSRESKVSIRFPVESKTLDELEAWLAKNTKADMFVLARLPLNPFLIYRLVRLQRHYGVAMLISPPIDERDLR